MRTQSLSTSVALLALSCFLHPTSAHADTYSFAFTTPANASYALTATGTFTTDSSGATQNITSLTGTIENGALTGDYSPATLSLIPVQAGNSASTPSVVTYDTGGGSYFYLYYDNILTPGSPSELDLNGLGIQASNGIGYEIGSDGSFSAYEAFNNSIGFDQRTYGANNVPLDITIVDLGPNPTSVTPEPGTITLLATGLMGVAGILRRNRRA